MPPIRTESSQKLVNQEGKILLALEDIKNGRVKSIRAAAKLYDLPRSTLQHRAVGRIGCVDMRPPRYKLTQLEEDALTEWIISIDTRGAAPRPATIGEMANILLAARDPKALRAWFATVQRVIDENGIQPEDSYNFDETGFAMGLIASQKVVTRAEYYGRRRLL